MKHLKYIGVGILVFVLMALFIAFTSLVITVMSLIITFTWKYLLILAGALLIYFVGKGIYVEESDRRNKKEDK